MTLFTRAIKPPNSPACVHERDIVQAFSEKITTVCVHERDTVQAFSEKITTVIEPSFGARKL